MIHYVDNALSIQYVKKNKYFSAGHDIDNTYKNPDNYLNAENRALKQYTNIRNKNKDLANKLLSNRLKRLELANASGFRDPNRKHGIATYHKNSIINQDGKTLDSNLKFVKEHSFSKVINERLLVSTMEHAIKAGILPNIFTDRDTARFGWVNKIKENRWIGQGTLAKMAKIYTNKLRVLYFQKLVTMEDILALNNGEVTEGFANIMEKLIAKATLDVKETMANNTTTDSADKIAKAIR